MMRNKVSLPVPFAMQVNTQIATSCDRGGKSRPLGAKDSYPIAPAFLLFTNLFDSQDYSTFPTLVQDDDKFVNLLFCLNLFP
jgi:hypothetical protein